MNKDISKNPQDVYNKVEKENDAIELPQVEEEKINPHNQEETQ